MVVMRWVKFCGFLFVCLGCLLLFVFLFYSVNISLSPHTQNFKYIASMLRKNSFSSLLEHIIDMHFERNSSDFLI